MKNKKLFAILTLVCFMFTLMPVAAFAYNEDASVVLTGAGKTDVDALTVTANTSVTVGTEGTVDNGSANFFFAVNGDGELEATTTGALTLKTPGTYEVYAMDSGAATTINGAYILKADRLAAYLEADSLVEEYATLKVKAADVTYVIDVYNEAGVKVASSVDGFTPVTVALDANGAYGAVKLTADLSIGGVKAVKGAALDFDNNGVSVVKVDSATARNGEFEFKVYGTIVGTYEVEVSYKDAAAVVEVQVGNVGPAKVEAVAAPTSPVDVNEASTNFGIGFTLTDANGNVIKAAATDTADEALQDNYGGALYKINVVDQPADSDIEGNTLNLAWDSNNSYWEISGIAANSNLEEGKYTFEVALENGVSASASVEIKEFDKAVAIKLIYPTTAGLNDDVLPTSIKEVDANGVTRTLAANATGLKLAANGAAVDAFTATTGKVEIKDDVKYLGSVVTVVAVYKDNFVASADIKVIEDAVELVYVPAGNVEVAKNNTLIMNVVNENGEKIALNVAANTTPVGKVIVLDKPEDAYVAANVLQVKNNNSAIVSFTPSVAGEYKLQVYVTYQETVNNAPVDRYISGIATVTVGATEGQFNDVVVVSIGADKIIVNSDVKAIPAPAVIKDSRTFVPFRALAEAFGATVDYDQATGAVTAELNGVKVVMMNGDKAYTVNGVAQTADVAPYLNVEASTTMVPVSFVAKAFGINYQCIYAEDGTVADVLFTK